MTCLNQTPEMHGPCGLCAGCRPGFTEQYCIDQIFRLYRELMDAHGWREIIYAPKDRPIEVLTIGSTGRFTAHWLDGGGWFVEDHGDLWPAKLLCWRDKSEGK